jgi:single-stranded-DNA-specific exonuclease
MMRHWQTAAVDAARAEALAASTGLPEPLCAVLATRGLTEADAVDAFLQPRLSQLSDPFVLPDMEAGVDRVQRALEAGETMLVYGDYDVDGITSTALMVEVLQQLGGSVVPFVPHRVDDGYGLKLEPVQRCLENHHPGLIITVDCGTSSVEPVEVARAAGVDVVITDHHEPGKELAPAVAVINPKRGDVPADQAQLAGVGVAFTFCFALLKRLREAGHEAAAGLDLRAYLDLVALGTIADMVALQGDNRILARHGLAELNRRRRTGVRALCEVSGVGAEPIATYQVGFVLGPRLNAAGRLDTAEASLRLMLSQDTEEADALADELNAANRDRQELERRTLAEALAQIEADYDPGRDYVLVVASRDWHPGVVGIVASRLMRQFHRPAVVVAVDADGIGRGSCRSIPGFHMVEGLTACAAILRSFGGHAMAAGLQVDEAQVPAFREALNAAARSVLAEDQLVPRQSIDAWVSLRQVDRALYDAMQRMGPFGIGNRQPVWAVRGARVVGEVRVLKEAHLKMQLMEGNAQMDAIAFQMAEREVPDGPIDVAFQLDLNRFRGRETLQMKVEDFRPSEPAV